MASKYTSILKNFERSHRELWRIVREKNIRQSHWIKDLRRGLSMSARQLGQRMGISSSTVRDMERREIEGTITLATLRKAAEAFDLELFYMFVPKENRPIDTALQSLIEERAKQVSADIIRRSAKTMQIEDQTTSQEVNEENTRELAARLQIELPRSLWD